MRAQSLWANIQGFPYPVSHLQGDSPKRLIQKYNEPGGNWALELDLLVANEIADQLNDSASSAQKKRRRNAKGAAAGIRGDKLILPPKQSNNSML